jgi:hypothetical protein
LRQALAGALSCALKLDRDVQLYIDCYLCHIQYAIPARERRVLPI